MWVDSCVVDLGSVRVGIQSNSAAAARDIADAFAPFAVDDPAAPRNFSVRYSSNRDRAHLLYWGGCFAARTFDPARLVRALVDHIAAHVKPPPGLVWVASLPFVRDGNAVLMPTRFDDDLRILYRQVRNEGYLPVDSPRALVDLERGELVVDDLLQLDASLVAKVGAQAIRRRAEPTVPYGRYPIERWVFIDYTGGCGPISRATATRAAILEILDGIEAPDERLVERVAAIFESTKGMAMFPNYRGAVLDSLAGRVPPA